MLQQDRPEDYVIATGEVHSVREFGEEVFGYLGLDWEAPAYPEADPGAATGPRSPLEVAVDLGVGTAQAAIRTTDLSHAYVEENSAYSS